MSHAGKKGGDTSGDGGATVTVTTETPPQNPGPGAEEIARIETRIQEIESSISAGIGETRQWTETSLSALRQEIADCQRTLQEVGRNLPQQMTAMREELTQSLQDLARKLEAPPPPPPPGTVTQATVTQVTPPEAPPANEEGTSEIASAPGASPNEPPPAPKPKKRVV